MILSNGTVDGSASVPGFFIESVDEPIFRGVGLTLYI